MKARDGRGKTSFSGTKVHFLEFVKQGSVADFEDFGRFASVPVHFSKDILRKWSFQVVQLLEAIRPRKSTYSWPTSFDGLRDLVWGLSLEVYEHAC